MDHDVGAFGDDRQLVVGDDRGDLDDDVVDVVEARHLEVHPHEHDHGLYRWHDDRVSVPEPPSERCEHDDDGFGRALAEPGAVEHVELRSPFGFMAFHGGALERQTDRIATAAAAAAGASLYVVTHPEPNPPHFPSTTVNGNTSPALRSFLAHVRIVVTVHGYGRDGMFTSLLLGGRNRRLAATMRAALSDALPDYEIVDDLDAIPRELRGLHRRQPGQPAARRRRAAGAAAPRPGPRARGGRTGRATGSCRRPPRSSTPSPASPARGSRRPEGDGRARHSPWPSWPRWECSTGDDER